MSDADSFIQEVSEEVRRDRMFGLWKRYAPLVLGGVVAVVGVAAYFAWRDSQDEQDAREAGARLIAAQAGEAGKPRAERFLAAADALPSGAALVARLRAAGELAAAGDAAGAAKLYHAIAISDSAPQSLAAFAAYRGALLTAAQGDAAGAVAALTPLALETGPFRLLALEARAALRLSLGEVAGAREDAQAVLEAPGATDEMRSRIGLLSAAIDAQEPSEDAK